MGDRGVARGTALAVGGGDAVDGSRGADLDPARGPGPGAAPPARVARRRRSGSRSRRAGRHRAHPGRLGRAASGSGDRAAGPGARARVAHGDHRGDPARPRRGQAVAMAFVRGGAARAAPAADLLAGGRRGRGDGAMGSGADRVAAAARALRAAGAGARRDPAGPARARGRGSVAGGPQEGRREGALEDRRAAVLELAALHGPVGEALAGRVRACDDLERLRALTLELARAADGGAVMRALEQLPARD